MKITLEVLVEEKAWTQHTWLSKTYIKKTIESTLTLLNWINAPAKVQVCILLTNNKQMQNLNYSFLGLNQPTNVLAFPNENRDHRTLLSSKMDLLDLGDIALGYQLLQEECTKYTLEFKDHVTHLLMHATLHTLGFDHQNIEDADAMYKIEDAFLEQAKIQRCIRSIDS